MKVAILGYDVEGQASYQYFTGRGDEVVICDRNPDKEVPDGAISRLGDTYLDGLDEFDLLVRTPGLRPQLILDKNPGVAGKITSGTNEFFNQTPTQNIIGITGTKGKGTTSSLVAAMLQASGHTVHLAGNIGVPALSLLPNVKPDDWVVLELSSFQLIDIRSSPHIAVCLMVVPEHLDWHADSEEYYTAKEQLFARQLPGDAAVYFHDNEVSKRIASAGEGQKVPFFFPPGAQIIENRLVIEDTEICRTDDIKLLGKHNWQNACAAVTAVWYAAKEVVGPAKPANANAMRQVLTTFSGLEHRLEFVRTVNDVKYYNDSFGTTPETAIVAIQAFEEPKVVILGGSDKGANYDELAKTVASGNVRKALLIGDQAGRIQAALDAAGFKDYMPGGESMAAIIANASSIAQPGDVVLLSTGCASFGMFQNYKDRGNQFKQVVVQLPDPTESQ